MEYVKDKISEFAIHSKNKNVRDLYRGINELKKGYQPRTYLVKDEDSDFKQIPKTFLLGGRTNHQVTRY
jgi:hypothetical protein